VNVIYTPTGDKPGADFRRRLRGVFATQRSSTWALLTMSTSPIPKYRPLGVDCDGSSIPAQNRRW
jgi:hypothetical protein